MQEVYAALAVIALKRKLGQNDQLSEDEFYAQFGEAPWSRVSRLSRSLIERLRWRRGTQAACRPAPDPTCHSPQT